ncbi:SpoIIE family protein phosphatase [Peterkaempfera bronchialis]|uniref:protein-serine/threonine phosphatase n=1 Tax=Peterkaempfera bronchialis TaxID=2126346 RepID=A0A345SXD7_9ACTN|nr:SpoIIE family protein phosphatase [Peterkaempfera bronchialis]AXI78392.1 GAF domain-containing protein [Peterkaempfera bronchialis]
MAVIWDDVHLLDDAHERFLSGRPVGEQVRRSILTSWQRCRLQGTAVDQIDLPYRQDLDLESSLVRVAGPVLDRLASTLSGMHAVAVLCDEHAQVLQRRAGEASLTRRLDAVQLLPGFGWTEQIAGTNGIGTALEDRRPAFIRGREHFADTIRFFACAAAPIRDPLSGSVQGLVDLTSLREDADPMMLTLVREAVADIEKLLLDQIGERERVLLRTFLQAKRAGGRTGTGVAADELLDQHDWLFLQEKAAELISSGRSAIVEVTLSCGQLVPLLSRPVVSPTGVTGIAVEALLPDGRLQSLDTTPGSTPVQQNGTSVQQEGDTAADPAALWLPPAARPGPPPAARPGPAPCLGGEQPNATDGWLLAVGEPGVGRLALLARRRLGLLCDAGVRIGTTLDVTRTAEELAEVSVPRFADFAAVDLPDAVLEGEEPIGPSGTLRRVAFGAIDQDSHLYQRGALVEYIPTAPQARCLASGQSVLEPRLETAPGWMDQDPARGEMIREAGIHSLITVPVCARGVVLGVASFYRSRFPGAFQEDDLSLAEELVSRAAVCIDNARRYTLEHTTALALQRSLLPRALPEQNAVEVAYRYLPAQAAVGGDWFDVIPLSGARVALAVGDVTGHGLHASATMGRLRTAVRNFSELDLPVDELLTHLDDLVGRLDLEEDTPGGEAGIIGATCLYGVYDPTTRRCALARAGHLAPALVLPDGTVDFPDVPAGPPLGLGGLPFETLDLDVPEGSLLVFYTDGLVQGRHRSIDIGLERMRNTLLRCGGSPEETCRALLEALLPARRSDDVALLVARTRALDARQVAHWELSDDPSAVSRLRTAVIRQLADWGLEELSFTTELIISELATNAIRYATPPAQVRLIRDRVLICEVSDCTSTSPRLRRAAATDEGGRGLFLVAQLAQRWGTRYTASGKAIWAEQPLPSPEPSRER